MGFGSVEIRRANDADIPFMAFLWAMLVLEENPIAKPQIRQWAELRNRLIKNHDYYAYVVTDDAGKIVGFADGSVQVALDTGETYVEGSHMFILPEYRKGQAGRFLHKMGTDLAKRVGAKFFRRYVNVINERMMTRMKRKNHSIRMYVIDEKV
jgi:GNAT superfamily N-acetyltransferase